MASFTKAELDVLFHVVNNCFGDAFEAALERAAECDDMSREQFIAAHNSALRKLSNPEY